MKVNPYSSPTDPDSSFGQSLFKREEERPFQIHDFQLDASIAGIRVQRASTMHTVFDGVMLLGTLFLCLSVLPLRSGPSSLVCLVFPIWFFLGVAWLANFTFRRGDDFAATCPGLIGKVTGRFSLQQIELRGPEICMACDVTGKQVRVTRRGFSVKVPGTEQVLQIHDQDIIETVESDDGRWWDDVGVGLLGRTGRQGLGDWEVVLGQRQLHGRDLVGLLPHRHRRNQAVIAGALACLALLVAFLIYLQVPPRVFGYDANDIKRVPYERMITAMYSFAFCSLPLTVFCIRAVTKLYRVLGTYNIVVSRDVVSVAKIKQDDRAGLTGAGLKQVRWTNRGLQILGKKDHLIFLMPSRWFDELQKVWLAERFGSESESVERDCYFGPRLG